MYIVTWDDNAASLMDDGTVFHASSPTAERAIEDALSREVRDGGPEDDRIIRPGDPGFIPVALRRLGRVTISGPNGNV